MGFEPAFARPQLDGAQYEVLTQLSSGQLGELALGRTLGQGEAGRLVTLRPLPGEHLEGLEDGVRRAAAIAHPRLVKVLGLAWVDGAAYLASEYVEGLSVADLARALRGTETSVIQEVALRIALDTLDAVSVARSELGQRGAAPTRCLYAETAWVATFGETLLSDVGLASELLKLGASATQRDAWSAVDADASPHGDVFAAGALLFELLTGLELAAVRQPSAEIPTLDQLPRRGPPIAEPLVEIVRRALALDPAQRYGDVEEMARAIRALPAHWLGAEAQVQAAIDPLVRRATDLHVNHSFDLGSGEHMIDPWEIPTRSLRQRQNRGEDDRVTLRPEDLGLSSEALLASDAARATRPGPEAAASEPCRDAHTTREAADTAVAPTATPTAPPRPAKGLLARLAIPLLLLLVGAASYGVFKRSTEPGATPSTPVSESHSRASQPDSTNGF